MSPEDGGFFHSVGDRLCLEEECQYFSKINVNAEVEDGTAVSQLMKYFKMTDPEDIFSLADRGMSAENIADIVKMNISIVKQWLEGAAVAK